MKGGAFTFAGAPTFIFNEVRKLADTVVLAFTLAENRTEKDAVALTITATESRAAADRYLIPQVTLLAPEKRTSSDTATFIVGPQSAVSRSGTPDSDTWGDAWTDAALGQTGVNHGNADPLVIQNLTANVRQAFVEVDLTKFTGLTATGNAHTFSFRITNASLALAGTYSFACQGQATRPFVESTITQANEPAIPTAITRALNVAANTTTTLTVTFTDAEMNQLLAKWVLIVITATDALGSVTSNITSRENATVANRMTIMFTAKV
jgi:hypothetical protein